MFKKRTLAIKGGEKLKLQTLLSLTFLLLNKKKITTKDVMNRYGVSKRTAMRYLDEITLSGIPLTVEYGRNGGYYVPQDYRIRYGYFTEEETALLKSVITALKDDSSTIGNANYPLLKTALIEKLSALK